MSNKPMDHKAIPESLLLVMAEKFRMLGDPTRLGILRALMSEGEMTVGQVVAVTHQGTANASRHLKQLAAAGILARRKAGAFVHYRLDDPVIEKICALVCDSLVSELEAQLKARTRSSQSKAAQVIPIGTWRCCLSQQNGIFCPSSRHSGII